MYTIVKSELELNNFFELVNYCHDALVKEVSIVSRGYVNEKGAMFGDSDPSDLRIIIQSQFSTVGCVEIIFNDVDSFIYNPRSILEPTGFIEADSVHFNLFKNSSDNQPSIIAKKMMYRILGNDYLGEGLLVSSDIPFGNILKTKHIENQWYQCENCLDIWEPINTFCSVVKCKSCGQFCEIDREVVQSV